MFFSCYVYRMDQRDSEEDLAFDIGYALSRAGLKLDIERCRAIAARIVAHLKLARWELRRRAPERPHG
jgi:hypothetical protein